MANGPAPDCRGRLCGYGLAKGELGCESGDGSCSNANFVRANESGFHTKELQEATGQIRSILNSIGPDRDGRTLSFIHTRMGTMLAWVSHSGAHSPDAITSKNSDQEIAKAFGIIPEPEEQAEAC